MKNKTVIITGATKGMGFASAERFLELGAKVVMVYSSDVENAHKVEQALSAYSDQMLVLQADITHAADREKIIQKTIDKFTRIHVLVNNAGIAPKSVFLEGNEQDFDIVLNVNLKAPIFLAELVAKQMIQQGSGGAIINFSSIAGHRGGMGGISYDAAKAGIIRATQTMANVLGQHNIRVNSISPGAHKTEMSRAQWENDTDFWRNMCNATALKRGAEAEEIAGTVVYLASDLESSYVTGIDIVVDGGYLCSRP